MFVSRKSAQSGFTLIEILVALALITLLAVGISLAFDGSRSRAQTLVSTMSELAAANVRLKNDTGCYADVPALLINSTLATTGSNNFCNRSLSATWNGPYVAQFPVDGSNRVKIDKVTDGAIVDFARVTAAGGSFATGKKYIVSASGLPDDIVTAALLECNGVVDTSDASFTNRKCRGTVSGAATGTFDVLFDETR